LHSASRIQVRQPCQQHLYSDLHTASRILVRQPCQQHLYSDLHTASRILVRQPSQSKPSERSSPSVSTPCGHHLRGLRRECGRLRGLLRERGRRYGLIVRLHGHRLGGHASVVSPCRCVGPGRRGGAKSASASGRQYRPASYSQTESKCW